MLQLRNIRKAYTTGSFTQTALDDVSISFRDSEFVAILGPSGSGKTTLLNIIGGLDHYDTGDLVIDGISTKEYKDRDWDTFRNNRVRLSSLQSHPPPNHPGERGAGAHLVGRLASRAPRPRARRVAQGGP